MARLELTLNPVFQDQLLRGEKPLIEEVISLKQLIDSSEKSVDLVISFGNENRVRFIPARTVTKGNLQGIPNY